jgi:hypothetical protein
MERVTEENGKKKKGRGVEEKKARKCERGKKVDDTKKAENPGKKR